jgi:hypothetical protein
VISDLTTPVGLNYWDVCGVENMLSLACQSLRVN